MALNQSDSATLDNVTDISEARKSKNATKPTSGSTSGGKATKKSSTSNRKFDHAKVAKLKAEIEAGNYKIGCITLQLHSAVR